MLSYAAIRDLHVGCVVVSGLGFALRGAWMLAGSAWLEARWVRIAPHVVDTALLASALALAVSSGQLPFVAAWLTAKVCGLIAYIGLGAVALRYGRTRTQRVVALILAVVAFAYIVSVALTRDPVGFLAGFAG